MRHLIVPFFACLTCLGLLGNVWAQEKTDRETMIHKNVKLAEMAVSTDIPADLADQYRKVLPVFRKVLTVNTKDQSEEKFMLIRISAGVKEVGSAKTKRALAHVTSTCQNSNWEHIGDLILHSYLTNGPVNEAEIEEFLRIQILESMKCYVPTARVFGSPKVDQEMVTIVAEEKPIDVETPDPAPAPAVAEESPANLEKSDPGI